MTNPAAAAAYVKSFNSYAAAHPAQSPADAYAAWFLMASDPTSAIGKALADEVKGLGSFAGDLPAAIPALNPANDVGPAFSLIFSGIGAWFVRGLKVLFGGILMLMAAAHLTGADNKLTRAVPYAALMA